MVVRVLSGVFRRGGVPNIVLGLSFCMAMFMKWVWICELECWMVLRSPVYRLK